MKDLLKKILRRRGFAISQVHPIERKAEALYYKYADYTMIPKSLYVDNLKLVYDFRNIEGCVVECGVWRGGMSAGMAEILPDREFYLFDSFEGLPPAKEIDGERALSWQSNVEGENYYNNCSAEMHFAQTAMEKSGVNHHLVKGWFQETLPKFNSQSIAVLRLDADWYESTMECLVNLYPHLAKGGIMVIDDYYVFDGCMRAVHDYLSSIKASSGIYQYNNRVAYLKK